MNKKNADKKMCELLAPAGGFDALKAAVQSGADAVYIGGNLFSARASASNFDKAQIEQAVEYAHLRGVKLHAALNTLIKQTEFNDAVKYASELYTAGVDALIVQDFGLARCIKQTIPDFELHASTQMTVHNEKDAEILRKSGYKRVVLARELSFEQIRRIKENVDIEVEMFVHGAICMSYSGQCLFSSILGGRSGNRGRCAQPCRLEYEFLKNEEKLKKGYLLSPKDMCLIKHVKEIKDAKIDSLKIEGRLKKPEYVAAVVGVYRKYLNSLKNVTEDDYNALLSAFNRSGFTDGYFTALKGAHMMSYKTPSNIADEQFSAEVMKRCENGANIKKVSVDISVSAYVGKKLYAEACDSDGNKVYVYSDVCETAKSKPVDREYLFKQFSRLGNTVYEIRNFNCQTDGQTGIGAGKLNAIRRELCDELDKVRTKVTKESPQSIYQLSPKSFSGIKNPKIVVLVQNEEQAKAAMKYDVKVYAPDFVCAKIKSGNIYTKVDDISECDKKYEKHILSSHLCHGVLGASADARLNVFNGETVCQYKKLGFDTVCLSPELNFNEIKKITSSQNNCEIIVYGYLPLMIMKNCVLKSVTGKCMEKVGFNFYLKDRKGEKFRILCNGKNSCTNTLLNSKPLYMADKAEDIRRSGADYVRINFTIETKEECEKILEAYISAFKGEKISHPDCFAQNKFTRGHFYRGVL